ncbi:hypothetical protein V1477_016251 [Vespula maculifrons]|uniref:Uncharacterized protein n=2 Tax=Vespula TaxID=7451 RepID=A0A834N928_VESVU|nr:hypothetical protein HZH66_006750 [Vespula vulgaris]
MDATSIGLLGSVQLYDRDNSETKTKLDVHILLQRNFVVPPARQPTSQPASQPASQLASQSAGKLSPPRLLR